jgi:hypothetical protein
MDPEITTDRAAIEAVKAIHYAWNSDRWLPQVITVCHECQDQAYPCRTVRIISSTEAK